MRSKHELKYIWSALETVLHSRSHLIAYAFLAFIAFMALGAAAAAFAAFFMLIEVGEGLYFRDAIVTQDKLL